VIHKIKSILVEAKNTRYYKYYINNNFSDGYSLKKDDMYLLLCKYVQSTMTSKIYNLLSKFQKFLLDVDKQEIYVIKIESQTDKLSKSIKQIPLKNLNKIKKAQIKENLKKSKKLLLYSNINTNERLNQKLIDRYERL